jgi:hypothetical protein
MIATHYKIHHATFMKNCQGYPCLAIINRNEVIAGDWSGNLVRFQLSPFSEIETVFAAERILGSTIVNNTFRSLCTQPSDTVSPAILEDVQSPPAAHTLLCGMV